jgi:26S proteasome regulatory subunit N3
MFRFFGLISRDIDLHHRVVHERGWMECGSGTKGAYGAEVSEAFNRRIGFCLGLHNESVKVNWTFLIIFSC